MGVITVVILILFVGTIWPLAAIFIAAGEFWAFIAAISINIFLSTVLVLLWNIYDYLKQLTKRK